MEVTFEIVCNDTEALNSIQIILLTLSVHKNNKHSSPTVTFTSSTSSTQTGVTITDYLTDGLKGRRNCNMGNSCQSI